jgi:hypothetical protein
VVHSFKLIEGFPTIGSTNEVPHGFGREVVVSVADNDILGLGVGDAEVSRSGVIPRDIIDDS